MSKTRHLDTAIEILRGTKGAKRAARKAQVEVLVTVFNDGYMVQINGKIVEEGDGNADEAKDIADAHAEKARQLGKTVTITFY